MKPIETRVISKLLNLTAYIVHFSEPSADVIITRSGVSIAFFNERGETRTTYMSPTHRKLAPSTMSKARLRSLAKLVMREACRGIPFWEKPPERIRMA